MEREETSDSVSDLKKRSHILAQWMFESRHLVVFTGRSKGAGHEACREELYQ